MGECQGPGQGGVDWMAHTHLELVRHAAGVGVQHHHVGLVLVQAGELVRVALRVDQPFPHPGGHGVAGHEAVVARRRVRALGPLLPEAPPVLLHHRRLGKDGAKD